MRVTKENTILDVSVQRETTSTKHIKSLQPDRFRICKFKKAHNINFSTALSLNFINLILIILVFFLLKLLATQGAFTDFLSDL